MLYLNLFGLKTEEKKIMMLEGFKLRTFFSELISDCLTYCTIVAVNLFLELKLRIHCD